MSYKVDTIANFERQAKKLIKKYRSLKAELATLIEQLEDKPMQGTDLGNGVYKIRLTIASKGKGKSGGARVITCVRVVQEKVYLISIYDKSQLENLSKEQVLELLQKEKLD